MPGKKGQTKGKIVEKAHSERLSEKKLFCKVRLGKALAHGAGWKCPNTARQPQQPLALLHC